MCNVLIYYFFALFVNHILQNTSSGAIYLLYKLCLSARRVCFTVLSGHQSLSSGHFNYNGGCLVFLTGTFVVLTYFISILSYILTRTILVGIVF